MPPVLFTGLPGGGGMKCKILGLNERYKKRKVFGMAEAIAAISTAQAPGGIGIVRISGEDALSVADKVFRGKGKLVDAKGYTAHYGKAVDGGGEIDEVIATVFLAPKSYTGENVVELSCHGGLYITQKLLRAVLSAGARIAGPGEFTKRAFLNGKMGLTSAEAVMDIISAQGEQSAKAALAGRNGRLEKRISQVKETLVESASHLAAWADFPEEDIPEVTQETLLKGLTRAREELEGLIRQFEIGSVLRGGVDTVILGRPNVGKSTLMNLLSGYEKSIVTPVEGTTRDIVEETIRLGDILLRLADTAGLRKTDDPVESIGVERARERMERAQLILAVFDASRPLTEEDFSLLKELKGKPAIAVWNKSDLSPGQPPEEFSSLAGRAVSVSAKNGEGVDELSAVVEELLGAGHWNPADGVLLTERQRDAASRALECIGEAFDAFAQGLTLDAVTVSIEGAIGALMELTGERAGDAVVEAVFSHFCVGK